MLKKQIVTFLLATIILSGIIYTQPAYAHNFGGDESATFLAKVAEIKAELGFISKSVSDSEALDYYSDAVGEYWNANDTKEMGERNALLQKSIPDTLDSIISSAKAGQQSEVDQGILKLNGYLDEAIPVRVDKDKLTNSTVQALAVGFILKESLEKYGDGVGAEQDLNDMSQMNMTMKDSTKSGSMSNMKTSVTVVDQYAYENSIGLATAAQNMFKDIATKNPEKSADNDKVSAAFTKLIADMNNKADANTVMMDVHVGLHPNLVSGYNIQVVPEFPIPLLMVIVSIFGIIAITKFKPLKIMP